MTVLYAQDFTLDTFVSLGLALEWPEESLSMAFSPTRALFQRLEKRAELFQTTDQGRIFSHQGEFKWRRVHRVVRAVYLGTPLPGLNMTDHSRLLAGLRAERGQVLLWGVRTELENEWLEQQVPQRFHYPLNTARFPRGRVALVLEHWLNEHNLPQFSRYHSLAEIKDEYHAPR